MMPPHGSPSSDDSPASHQQPPPRPPRAPRERPSWRAVLWLRRQRVRGRRRFIWAWGVLRLGVPIAALATLLRFLDEPFRWVHFLAHLVVNVLVAGIVGGYVMGALLWALVVGRGRRPRPAPPRRPSRGRGDTPRS